MPDLRFLDLKMPGMAGPDPLEEIDGDDPLRSIPGPAVRSTARGADSNGRTWVKSRPAQSETAGWFF